MVLRSLLAVAVVAAVFVGILPRLADLSEARGHATTMGGLDLATLGIVAAAGLLIYTFVLTAVMPGLSVAQAIVVNQSSTAVANTMPAGGVLGVGVSYRFYGSWGHSKSAITLNVLLTGIGNIACKLALPIIALVVLGGGGNASLGLLVAALVGARGARRPSPRSGASAWRANGWRSGVGLIANRVIGRVRSWLRRPAPPATRSPWRCGSGGSRSSCCGTGVCA